MATPNNAPEANWLAVGDPIDILVGLGDMVTWRKRLLFACACCRHMQLLLPDLPNLSILDHAELYTNGPNTFAFMRQSGVALEVSPNGVPAIWAGEAIYSLCHAQLYQACEHAARAVRDQARGRDWHAARKQQTTILCDVLGHLLYPTVTFDSLWLQWNDGTVRKMAQAIYKDNTFADVPILADALEEAGCENAAILHHCRAKIRHYRGCWVVDALLDKK